MNMGLITAIIRKERLNDILTQLSESDVHGIIVTPVQGHGGEIEEVHTYRGLTVKMGLAEKVRLDIGLTEPFVERTVSAILKAARTGEVGDGKCSSFPSRRSTESVPVKRMPTRVTPVLVGT